MWPIFILCAVAGLFLATHHPTEPPADVVPLDPGKPSKLRTKPILRLVKAMKKAVAYPMTDTIELGPQLTLAPLLDPGKLDEQAATLRAAGKVSEADKMTKLAASVRAAILKKYTSEPAFAAKVKSAGKKG